MEIGRTDDTPGGRPGGSEDRKLERQGPNNQSKLGLLIYTLFTFTHLHVVPYTMPVPTYIGTCIISVMLY